MSTFQNSLPDLTRPAPADGPAIYVETYGCQMNVYDSQAISGVLEGAGYRIVDNELVADAVLLNTCSVREHAEHKVISRVGEIRHRRLDADLAPAVIGICGCMAERLGDGLRKGARAVDLVVGVDNYDALPRLLGALLGTPAGPGGGGGANAHASTYGKAGATVTGHRQDAHYVAPPDLYPTNGSHLVTIHKGCDYKCTYCIVPMTRGPQSEKAPEVILAEIEGIVAGGGREVTLLGQNVTAYRWQDSLDFAGLLEQVAAIDGLERIRFLTGHPRDMHRHLMDAIGRLDKVCPWLHVPAQSGSDAVLRRMKRLYTAAEYLDMVAYAQQVIPGVSFSSDFIVGFPGETDADFRATLDLVRRVKYDQIFSFKYSERPGVPAAKLADDVPLEAKKDRLAELMDVQQEIWTAAANARVGDVVTAVCEGAARRPAGAIRLRTANNRKIVVTGLDVAPGAPLTVRLTGWEGTTFFGEPVTA